MSIASEITRLNNAKAAIKQSLTNKGVEVSDEAKLDEYPALIDSIEVGGEGGDPYYETMWNAITNNNTDYKYLFSYYNGTKLDLSKLDTSNVTSMDYMLSYCTSLTSLDLSNFVTDKVLDMAYMFVTCIALTELDLSNFNTESVVAMTYMFSGCSKLETLDLSNFNMKNVSTSSKNNMFRNCNALHTLRLDNCPYGTIEKIITSSNFPTNAIEGVTRTIYCKEENAAGLVAPTNWVFSYIDKVEEPSIPLYTPGEFQENTEITEVRTMVDESHDDLNNMFAYCTNLVSVNTEDWDTSNVTNMGYMFQECTSLTSIDVSNWDTSNVTDMSMMFQGCTSLTQLDLSNFDTSYLSMMDSMFNGCTSLTTLDLSNWDATLIYAPDWEMRDMFLNCNALHTLRLDNCSNDTISKIIKTIGFPTNAISGVIRTIYCKESEAAGLTAPTNWVFSYVD